MTSERCVGPRQERGGDRRRDFRPGSRVGPVRRQAQWLNDMLQDPTRSRIHLVTLAEEMPVAETLETSEALAGRLQIDQGPVFANGIYSELLSSEEANDVEEIVDTDAQKRLVTAADEVGLRLDAEDLDALIGYARFLEARRSIQAGYLSALRAKASSAVLELPFLFSAGLALPDIETLADVIEEKVEKL